MKFVYCISLVLTVLGSTLCQSSNENTYMQMLAQLKHAHARDEVQVKLITSIKRVCPNKEIEDIEAAVDRAQTCADNESDFEYHTLCSILKTSMSKCISPLIDFMENCLPERSRDIPVYVTKVFQSLNEYLCRSDGEHLLELMNPCASISSYRFGKCIRRLRSKLQQYQREPPSASQLCSSLKSLQPCYVNFVENSCNNPITKSSYLGFFDAVMKPCSDYSENEIESVETVESFKK